MDSSRFNDDEMPAPPTTPNNAVAGDKQGLVTLSKKPNFDKPDVAMTVADSVTAVLEIKAAESSAGVREGLDLVAVVDVSGSMEHKIGSLKRALQFVIMKLTPADRLSIVTFESTARRLTPLRVMTKDAQDELKAQVDKDLKADGGTDIKTGLELGLAVLAGRVHTESRTANIFLMSDGRVEGTKNDPTETDPGEVPVYTFGFGEGTDHKLLCAIATKSVGGTYSSVPDGTNLSDPFARLLGGLVTVVAQDVRLILRPKTSDPDLDSMVVVPLPETTGKEYTQTTDAKDRTITIKFGTLFSGETRKVAVNFTLKPSTETRRDKYKATLAVARHSYAGEETPQSERRIIIERRRNPSSPASAGIEEQWARAEVARRKYAGFVSEANDLADEATRMAKEATATLPNGEKEIKDQAKMVEAWNNLEAAQRKLEEAQDEVENITVDDGDRMVNTLRSEVLQLIAYMQSHDLYDKLGRPYALATITSHYRQRAAGRGDLEITSCLYVTKRMIAYVEQAKAFEENPKAVLTTADEDAEKEVAENPLAGIAASLDFYLDNAIQSLQAIQKLVATAARRT